MVNENVISFNNIKKACGIFTSLFLWNKVLDYLNNNPTYLFALNDASYAFQQIAAIL